MSYWTPPGCGLRRGSSSVLVDGMQDLTGAAGGGARVLRLRPADWAGPIGRCQCLIGCAWAAGCAGAVPVSWSMACRICPANSMESSGIRLHVTASRSDLSRLRPLLRGPTPQNSQVSWQLSTSASLRAARSAEPVNENETALGLLYCRTSCVLAGGLIQTSMGWVGGVGRPAVKRSGCAS